MFRDRRRGWKGVVCAAVLAAAGASCRSDQEQASGPSFGGERDKLSRPGVTKVAQKELPEGGAAGVLYVPVYSHAYTDDAARPFHLAATLAVRNTDPGAPRFLTSVKYFDSDGRMVREYAPRPFRIAPMAAAEFFVRQSDTTGGSSASFLVAWSAATPGAGAPLAEAVMVGTATNQVVSFTSLGRAVTPTPAP